MAGIYHILNIGSEGLFATRQGVDTTGHNIANAQTEGYSRQRVQLTSRSPHERMGHLIGNGTQIKSIHRAHDKFIEKQINDTNRNASYSDTLYSKLRDIESIYSPELNANISDELTNFFNSLQNLSNYPDELNARVGVRESALNLIGAFQRVDKNLEVSSDSLNENILHETNQVSELLKSISDLNISIRESEIGAAAQANDLRDQRDALVRDLSTKLDVNYYEDDFGMLTVRGPKDTLLVEGPSHSTVKVVRGESKAYRIIVEDGAGKGGRDVTNGLKGGSLKGLVEIRDKIIPNLVQKHNSLVGKLVSEFNAIHREGFGINGYSQSGGRNFFKPISDLSNAARYMSIDDTIAESIDAISAASTANAPGDNVTLNRLIDLKDFKMLEGGNATMTDYYANYVGVLGSEVMRADHLRQAEEQLRSDLNSRREEVSGVSLDEEAANLLKWQTAFTANSKVITTADEMLQTVLSLKR